MLKTLRIRHLAVIEDLTLAFGPGLNVLTGETGAGKSILVDAVGLAAGDRAEAGLIRTGEERAVIEAVFALPAASAVAGLVKGRGLDADLNGELVVRREVRAAGSGGRVFVNGSPATVALLREIGDLLVELHGQHEHQSLLSAERHLDVLDAFGGLGEKAARVRDTFEAVQAARSRLAGLREVEARRLERAAALGRVLGEIDAVRPRPGETESLDRERRVLQNAGRVAVLLDEAISFLHEGEPSATSLASAASRRAQELAGVDPSLSELAERIEAARIDLQEAGASLRDYRAGTDFDPSRLEAIESRRAALSRLLLRYGPDEDAVSRAREAAAEELLTLQAIEGALAEAGSGVVEAERVYVEAARALSGDRHEAARRLGGEVEAQLQVLALQKAHFEAALSTAPGAAVEGGGVPLSPRGAERAEFLLTANPGEEARPLARVASGGELSRVMLGLHLVFEGAAKGRVLVFDEVDAGVAGAVADAVGQRLARLARRSQVLLVTHLPQVAAYADHHYHVVKKVSGGRTRVDVVEVKGAERVEELARMLGGRGVTPTSRRHAEELLQAAGGTGSRVRGRA